MNQNIKQVLYWFNFIKTKLEDNFDIVQARHDSAAPVATHTGVVAP